MAPTYLFVQLYDFQANRFRRAEPKVTAASLPTIVASRTKPAGYDDQPRSGFRPHSASTLADDDGRASNLRAPAAVADGKTDTAWAESAPGNGHGHFLVARRSSGRYRLTAISIIPGDASSALAFRNNNRLKSVVISFSAKDRFRIRFAQDPAKERGAFATPYWIMLPQALPVSCAQLTIEDVYRGKRQNRTAVSELQWHSELRGEHALPRLLGDLQSIDAAPEARRILGELGHRGITAAAAALPGAKGNQKRELLHFLTESGSTAAIAPLIQSLGTLRQEARNRVLQGLERFGAAGAKYLAQHLESPKNAFQPDLVLLLAKLGGADAERVLLAQLGHGDEARRSAVALGLTALQQSGLHGRLLQRLQETKDAAQRSDLIRILSKRALNPDEQTRLLRMLLDRWKSATAFEERYRILHALKGYANEAAHGPILSALKSEDPILRREALALLPAQGVDARLVAALADSDPGVRLAAAIALKTNRSSVSKPLAQALKKETWPVVAFGLAEALGKHCGHGRDALVEALNRPLHSVDQAALRSLIACRGPYLARDLLAMGNNVNWRTYLRKQAMAGFDKALAQKNSSGLRILFNKLRQRAGREPDDEEVALVVARALALAGDKAAVDALTSTLALDPRPPLRAGAARALSINCPASARAVLKRAVVDSNSLVQRSAKAALKRCSF